MLTLVHDEALWLGERMPIDDMLIRRIITLPCARADPTNAFFCKSQEKNLSDQVNKDFNVIKKS